MKLEETRLPWNDAPVRSTGDIHPYLTARLPGSMGEYLPSSITLFVDPEVDESRVASFLDEMIRQLAGELRSREVRRDRFVKLGLFRATEIHSFLTGRRHLQPWAIYYSASGGLKAPAQNPDQSGSVYGVVPCSTMQNHGVAWRRVAENYYQVWLVTARKEGHDWDWDSDVGHESAHSAFAQIPLFVQTDQHSLSLANLSLVKGIKDLNPYHLSRMGYMFTEISVIAMRGEKRVTETGLPVAENREELHALLALSDELMPGLAFNRALAAYNRAEGFIDVNESDEMFEIGAAAMRVVPHISRLINNFTSPTIDWYRSIT